MPEFTDDETAIVKRLIREALRKGDRSRASLVEKYGSSADFTALDIRRDLLRSAYIKLGGDPDRIANLKQAVDG